MENQTGEQERYLRSRIADLVRELSDLAESATAILTDQSSFDGFANARRNSGGRSDKAHLRAAQTAYRLRRQRTGLFQNAALFGEPAWDMLLDLYIAGLKGKALTIADACIGAAAPETTALRWIAILQEEGLIAREEGPDDGRAVHLHLTQHGLALMQTHFDRTLSQIGQ